MFTNSDAELLAMEISGAVLPPPDLYDQIDRDLTAIRQSYPFLASIHHRSRWPPGKLIIAFTEEGAARFEKGEYHELKALNTKYGPVKINSITKSRSMNVYLITFQQRYNPKYLIPLYQAVDGVSSVTANRPLGDGNNIEFANGQYTFKVGWGDCRSGCIHRHYWVFTVVDNVITLVEERGSPLITGLRVENDGPTILGQSTTLSADVSSENYYASYAWAFGDGTSGTGKAVDYIYPAVGNYIVTVTASSFGSIVEATTTVIILPNLQFGGDGS